MQLKKLAPYRIQIQAQAYNTWCVTPEPGTTFEEVLRPEYWCNVLKLPTGELRPWDRVVVRDEAFDWCAELVIVDTGSGWAKVKTVTHTVFDHLGDAHLGELARASDKTTEYEIKYAGPIDKHVVIRLADKQKLKNGMSKVEAHVWLNSYLRTIEA